MKITNAELMAKIASGQILPGICKNIQINNNNNTDTNTNNNINKNVNNEVKIEENQKIVQKRLYNKYYNFHDEKLSNDLEEKNKNVIASYLIKCKEPNITSLVQNEKDLEFEKIFNQINQNTVKKEKEFKNEYKQKTSETKTTFIDETENFIEFHNHIKSEIKLENEVKNYVKNDVKTILINKEITVPLPIEKFALESGSDIILKGANIILGVNNCGLIGNTTKILPNIADEINISNVGLIYENFEFMSPIFNSNDQKLNFNCSKIIYKTKLENKCVINANLYETANKKQVLTQNNNSTLYESLIPVKHYNVCADDILSSETIGKSKDLTHTISYSFRKSDNKISINITLTNTSKQTLTNVKYYYAMNLNTSNNKKINNVSHLKTSPHETGIFCIHDEITKKGIYLRSKEVDSFVFIDKEWDWLYNDKWDKIKLPKNTEIEREDLAITGLAFNKTELKPQSSWSINFSIGFTTEYDFISKEFSRKPTGLCFANKDFSYKLLHNIITTCADFTDCNLSGADLFANSLEGAITGPLAFNSEAPSKLPHGYKFIESDDKKYIIGPGVILLNTNLINIDFTGVNLSMANLSGSDLSNSIFSNTNLSNAIVSFNSSHDISLINMREYTVREGILFGPKLIYLNENFSNMDLSDLNLSGCIFSDCNFSSTNIANSNFSNCKFDRIIPGPFEQNQVIGTILPLGYQFIIMLDEKVCIAGPKVNFSSFDLSNTSLTNIDLSEANLSNTIITNANFSNCKLTNTITGPVICYEDNLILPRTYKIISNPFTQDKYIIGPNIMLINRNLNYFDFSNVNMSGAKFIFCDLSNVNLTNTNLENACLPLVIGPLSEFSGNPINYQKTMSLEKFDGTKWLIYRWEHYKWDVFSSQLHQAIYNN